MMRVNKKRKITKGKDSERLRVVCLGVNVCDYETTIGHIVNLVKAGNGGYICISNVHMVMESFDNPEFCEKVNGADWIVPDGVPLVWLLRLQGAKEATQVRGPSLMPLIFRHAEKENLSIGFFGGKQEVLEAIQDRIKIEYPNLRINYAFSPPFRRLTKEEHNSVVDRINRFEPDILFVGLGCPKQENWMVANRSMLKPVMVGVGAAFDMYAGVVPESPKWLQRVGLEWLFRLFKEPRRLWKRYLLLNPRFLCLAAIQLLGGRKP